MNSTYCPGTLKWAPVIRHSSVTPVEERLANHTIQICKRHTLL